MTGPASGDIGTADILVNLSHRLAAPEPGWTTHADAIVIGSGVAGLTAALELCGKVGKVVLLTKTVLSSGSTVWAQGGIAAALDPQDSVAAHRQDTLVAGGGLCDEYAVDILVGEGPARVRELVARGALFDRDAHGKISLGLEGGHHASRIAHAGGDATGAEISRALVAQIQQVRDNPDIDVIEHAQMIDILTDHNGHACGVTLHVMGAGSTDGVGAVLAPAVVLATGGIGQLYRSSTNPPQATADGLAAAMRVGAQVADMEFVQFHPTVLWLGAGAKGQLALISEAVRGEGAYLLDVDGTRFMKPVHPLAELAPRDVVSQAIVKQMAATGSDHVLLDARHLGGDFLTQRFPTITRQLAQAGFDFGNDLIPVAPAQHFHSGGILTDEHGRTSIPGLYAVGECACTGVHGANRLASNSLLEGLVFGYRAAQDIIDKMAGGQLSSHGPAARRGPATLVAGASRSRIQRIMTNEVGAVRQASGLEQAWQDLNHVPANAHVREDVSASPQSAEWETSNLLLASLALTLAAKLRTESRGGHFRADYPQPEDAGRYRTVVQLDPEGKLVAQRRPITLTAITKP